MNLGFLIRQLELFDPAQQVTFDLGYVSPTLLDSWRGRYEELALGYGLDQGSVGGLLDECRRAVGKTFQGYKGGDFTMSESTPVCVDRYGEYTNTKLIAVTEIWGDAVLITQRIEE